jgi:HK97 family phage prohead protease
MTTNLQRERRILGATELRLAKDGDVRTIVGYAAVFNSEAVIAGMWREKIMPGAFAKALPKSDIRALFNHDPNFVLGRNGSKTLRLKEDDKGLRTEIVLPDSQTVRDLVVAPMDRGDITGMSFQVIIGRDGAKWDDSEKGKLPLRTIHSFAEIFDVSVVTFPAFEATEAELRSVTAEIDALRQAGKSALISEIELRRLKMKGRLSAVHGMAR